MRTLLFIFLGIQVVTGQAVIESFEYSNQTYVDYIETVEFGHSSLSLTLPVVDLNSSGRLRLEFDDREGTYKTYKYRIIHCDKDWFPSDIEEMEYIDGFNDEEIDEFAYSTNAYSEYTHYELFLPNDDINWIISGNYLLLIYDDELEIPVITRKFVVAENSATIMAEFVKPQNLRKRNTHHELSLTIDYSGLRLSNARQELYTTIIQNGNWTNAMYNLQGNIDRGTTVVYDDYDWLNFPALKEFRSFDTRTLKSRTEFVHSIEQNDIETFVLLDLGKIRPQRHYEDFEDANGGFIISNRDFDNGDVSSEYVNVIFTLETDPFYEDLYLMGGFCDWQAREEYKMEYDSENGIYKKTVSFKQGYYDYVYALVDKEGNTDIESVEGSWFETENDYLLITYLREYGGLYDRVVGIRTITSFY